MPADALGGLDGSGETESIGRGALGSPAGSVAFAVETADLTRGFGSLTAADAHHDPSAGNPLTLAALVIARDLGSQHPVLLLALLADRPGRPVRTEGNPLFLEESVRTLVETKALVGERGAHRLVKALPTIQVPATVQAVLAARIDRLPAEHKWLLQSAAVVGHEVSFTLLQAIAEENEEQLRPARGRTPRGRDGQ